MGQGEQNSRRGTEGPGSPAEIKAGNRIETPGLGRDRRINSYTINWKRDIL